VTRRFDARFRLSSVLSGSDVGERWWLDSADRRSIASRANGVIDSFAYDADDRLTHILRSIYYPGQIDPSVLVMAQYGYDAEGNRKFTANYPLPDRSESYGYDNVSAERTASSRWGVGSGRCGVCVGQDYPAVSGVRSFVGSGAAG
jgi:hypothetical protein